MNHCYRLVFNKSSQVWQVVSEIAKSHSKSASNVLLPLLGLFPILNAWADPLANALPINGQVVSGQSSITQNGNQLNIVQTTQKSIINWNSYNIGANAQVTYLQPNANAISLNRVTSSAPSEIFGKLNANGQVWLINPNGVLFGKNAQVNVGGIVATTLNIADDDFLNGNYRFTGNSGSVVNLGNIVANSSGYVAMLAPEVRNEGLISAIQGTVALAAGNAMTLDFNGNGLINVQVDSANINMLIENKHLIQVGNGQVLMSTKAANGLITSVINNSGKIEANSMVNDGGVIRLTGAKTVINSGDISATSSNQKGGTVHLLGDNVGMFNASSVNVSGKTGGGTILVGGDLQGKNADIQNASKTFVHQNAKLIADATESGDGGKVIVWADDITRYYGHVSAKGGAISGNGGFVEVSGKRLLNFFGAADLSAVNGKGGNLLLDPENITISNGLDTNTLGFTAPLNADLTEAFADDAGLNSVFDVTALTGSFSGVTAGSTITLQANNDITIGSVFNVATATGSANNSLILEANNNINVNAALTLDGLGALTLRADADSSGAGNLAISAAIKTNIGGANLYGANITGTNAGTINTTGATNANSGNVNIVAGNAINLAGVITTSGITATGTNAGLNAGNVTLSAGGSITSGSITADGSQATNASNLKGGNAGNIVIRNTGSVGDITLTDVFARNGSASGTGAGGNAATVNIENLANSGNIEVSNISMFGNQKGNGGNLTISSKAGVEITGLVTTNAGAANTGEAGNHAGNVAISGVNRTIRGAVTAIGSAGTAGGNAGIVSITGTGTLNTATINVRTGSANGTGAGGLAGSVNLTGSDITVARIDTSGNTNGNGGTINANASGLLTLNNVLTSSGGTANSGTAGKNAGAITLSGNTINATAATISANGSNGAGASQNGGNGAAVTLNGSGNISTNAISATGGSASATNAAGGDAGSIVITTNMGDITTNDFGLNARTGAGLGTGGISNGGSIAITNTSALGKISIGSINTSGNTNGSGGSISVKGKNTVTVGSVDASGGSSTGTRVGRSAGNVTIEGANRTIGTVTTNGGLASGANFTGGRAGAISITGAGTLNAETLTSKVGSPTGSGAFGTEGSITLSGSNVSTQAIDTSPASTGNGGNVNITTTGTGNSNIASINANNIGAITINNADTFSIDGVIAGANTTVTKSGSGKLILSGNNTYTGLTSIQSGTLSVTNVNALGAISSGTTVNSGAVLDVNGVTLASEAITLNSAATLTATNTSTVTGTVSAADNSKIGTASASSSLTIDGVLSSGSGNTLEIIGAGDVVATNAANNIDIVKITNAKNVTLRDADSLRFSNTASSLTSNLMVTAANSIALQSGGSVTSTDGNILFTSNVFTNNAGANALIANSGRWVVHTNALAGNTFGGLNSGNQAIYNRGLGVATAETGNRYVFAESPALNITSINQSKTYGVDAAATVANAFTANTFVNAATYGNVFTQDTITNALTGSATSAGSAAASNVGIYSIDVSSFASSNGYTLTKLNTGNLTVNPAAINLAGTRVYDATTAFNASAFGTINGVNGQILNLSGTGSVASKNVGTQSLSLGNLALINGTGSASNYTLSTGTHTGTITQATLNLSAVSDTKTYDGNTNSTGVVVKTGLVGTDTVTNLTQKFGNKNVLSPASKTLSVNSNYVINDGNNGNNYMVSTATASGDINPLAITGSITAANKTYDGNDIATITTKSLTGVIGLDNVTYTGGSANFDNANANANAGTGKTVTATGLSLTGTDAGNYSVNTVATTTANINKATLNLNAVADSKTYDGNTDSTGVVGTSGLVGGDTVTNLSQRYNSKNVLGANGSTLIVKTGYSVNDGNSGNNYTVNLNSAAGTITPFGITGSITASNKTYDANNTATIASRTLTGVIGSDNVSYTGGNATFDNKNVGTGKTVTATGLSLTGTDAANYTVNTSAVTTADITQASLNIKANNASKVQGNPNPAFSSTFTGFVGGETPAVLGGNLNYSTTANTASAIGTYSVTPFGATSSNYDITFTDGILTVTAFVPPVMPDLSADGSNVSVFNNALTRPEQAIHTCGQVNGGTAMIDGLDAFGVNAVDYEPPISQPLVGGVVANALVETPC